MAKPKLALIPASQGTKVYSVLPSDGSGDFDFTRSSKATRINSQGLIEEVISGQSRLEYPLIDGVVNGCPSLLLEPQSTNLVTYSEDFSQSVWGEGNVLDSLISNNSISPDGTLNADTFVCGVSGYSSMFQIISTLNAQLYTLSVFVKKGNQDNFSIELRSVGSSADVVFDLENGTIISGADGEIKKYPNGWYRCSLTKLSNSTSTIVIFGRGNSGNIGDSFQIYGAMLEQKSYATSYIKTAGTTITRLAETATGAGTASTFNDSEGVLMVEISALADDSSYKTITLNNNGTSDRIQISINSNDIYIGVIDNVTQVFDSVSVADITDFNKVAVSYILNNCQLWINGFKVFTDTSASMPSGLSQINFDKGDGGDDFYGKTKQLQYYNTALTDSELEKISSWTSFLEMTQAQQYKIK